MECLCLLIASAAHDVGHPGVSNAFMINSQSNLAQRYNDEHVLESYHAATTFALLQREGCELLKGLSPAQFREARELIIGTDLWHRPDCAFFFCWRLSSANCGVRKAQQSRPEVADAYAAKGW
jgi:hypothetical protein